MAKGEKVTFAFPAPFAASVWAHGSTWLHGLEWKLTGGCGMVKEILRSDEKMLTEGCFSCLLMTPHCTGGGVWGTKETFAPRACSPLPHDLWVPRPPNSLSSLFQAPSGPERPLSVCLLMVDNAAGLLIPTPLGWPHAEGEALGYPHTRM